jgi:hypothetical protein
MNAPSPFHTALAVGNNIAAGVKSYQDRTAIDEILDQASKTGNPEDVDYAMTQILSRVSPEKQQIALAILQKKKGEIEAKNEKMKIKSAYKSQGIPDYVADLDPASQKEFFKQKAEQDKRNKKSTAYQQANLPGYYADLDPLTQRTLIQNQQESSLFNQIFGNNSQIAPSQGFPQKSSQGSPNENPQMEVIDGVPSVWVSQEEANAMDQEQGLPQSESAPMNMTNTLDKFSLAPQSAQQQQPKGLENLSDQQLVLMSGLKGAASQIAKAELQRRQEAAKINEKNLSNKIKRDESISLKAVERAESIAESLPQKRSAQRLMNDAIARKDLSFWSWDNIAELTGMEGLRSPEGAIFKTAGKEYFLGSIARAGARPNQWIEQQISDMMAKVGRSTEANLSVSRALENELDLDEERVKLTRELSRDLENKLGYIPRDLGEKVDEQLKVFAERKQKELYNDLRAIKSIGENKNEKFIEVVPGTPVSKLVANALLKKNNNDPKKAREEAKKLGYSF